MLRTTIERDDAYLQTLEEFGGFIMAVVERPLARIHETNLKKRGVLALNLLTPPITTKSRKVLVLLYKV